MIVALAVVGFVLGLRPAHELAFVQPLLDGWTIVGQFGCATILVAYGIRARSPFALIFGAAYALGCILGFESFDRAERAGSATSSASALGMWVLAHALFAALFTLATVAFVLRRDEAKLGRGSLMGLIAAIALVVMFAARATSPYAMAMTAHLTRAGSQRVYFSLPEDLVGAAAILAAIAVGASVWAESRDRVALHTAAFAIAASAIELVLGLMCAPQSLGWYAEKAFAAVATVMLLVAFVHELTWRRAREKVADEQTGAFALEREGDRQKLLQLAYHDELTGIHNRAHWLGALRDRMRRGAVAGSLPDAFSVLFVDLDRFKDINDRGGHAFGDAVLIEVAQRVRSTVQATDEIGRLGGDEFAILCDRIDPESLAKRLCDTLHTSFTTLGYTADLSVTIGIARYPTDGTTVEDLLRNADQALYHAKRGGGNTFTRYDTRMAEDRRKVVAVRQALASALTGDEFTLYYQPIFEIATRRCESVEALIRWNNASLGAMTPDVFIPIAEDSDLMREIGRFTLETAAEQIDRWHGGRSSGMPGRIAVNVSVRQLRDAAFFDHIVGLLRKHNIAPRRLELEITESAAMADMDSAVELLTRCRTLGLCITLDDFGTHYSSLTHLQRLPVDTIKIDKSFITGCHLNADDASIVRSIIGLGHDRGRRIVAEGIETPEQLRWLRDAGCDFAQGFLLARPMPEAELTQRLVGTFSQHHLDGATPRFQIG